jgi:opacity protein-like surface antigen
MKRIVSALVMATATVAAAVTQMPDAAQAGGKGFNQIGPSVTFGNGSSVFGINSKLGIADNLSLRPFVTFPSNATTFGTSLTYDFDLGRRAPITPFVGAGIEVASFGGTTETQGFAELGADFNISRDFALTGIVDIPFNSNNGSTTFTAGANFRF